MIDKLYLDNQFNLPGYYMYRRDCAEGEKRVNGLYFIESPEQEIKTVQTIIDM